MMAYFINYDNKPFQYVLSVVYGLDIHNSI